MTNYLAQYDWKIKIEEHDVTGELKRTTDMKVLVEYLTTLESTEQNYRTRNARRMAGNRRVPERAGRQYNQERRQQNYYQRGIRTGTRNQGRYQARAVAPARQVYRPPTCLQFH